MGRPGKVGLDYFFFDVYCDNKMKLIEAEFGLKGFAVIVKLWQKIYAERGYYCEFDEEVALLFADSVRMSGSAVSEIVRAAVKRGIFDAGMYEKYKILTSHGIQKRYMDGTGKRVRVELEKQYLLLSEPEINDNVVINGVSVGRNSFSDGRNTQSRVEETRLDKSIVEKRENTAPSAQKHSHGKYKNVLLTDEELQTLKNEFPSDWKTKIDAFSYSLAMHGYRYNNHLAAIMKWAQEDKSKAYKSATYSKPKNGFNNYVDTNPVDYDKLEELILDGMLGCPCIENQKEESK